MAELEQLKKEKKNIKSSLTRFVKFIDKIDLSKLDNDIVDQVEIRLESITSALQEFKIVHTKLGNIIDDEQNQNELEKELEEFENKYFNSISKARSIIRKHRTPNPVTPESVVVADPNLPTQNNAPLPRIKLPIIELPNFDGDLNNYLYFRDTFISLIHGNSSLSNIEKFHYLRASLKGKPLELVESLDITENSYELAWKLLRENYENDRNLVYNHIKAIFNAPNMQRETYTALRQLYDEMDRHLHALELLKQPVKEWDTPIIFLITDKFDSFTRRHWEEFIKPNELPKMTQLRQFFKERCAFLNNINNSKKIVNVETKTSKHKAFPVSVANEQRHCPKCKENHFIQNCPKFLELPVNSRAKEIKHLQLCINCLRPGHQIKDCRSNNCKKCDRKHNTLLHFSNVDSNENNASNSPKNKSIVANNNSNDDSATKDNTSSNAGTSACSQISFDQSQSKTELYKTKSSINSSHSFFASGSVLLSTAIVRIKDKNGQYHDCRALLDSGSESNFVTKELSNKLQLKETKINFCVSGISHHLTQIKAKTELTIYSRTNSYKKVLSCLIIPQITDSIPNTTIDVSNLNIPENISLADPKFNIPSGIDILIGADTFYGLLAVGQIKLNEFTRLQKTLLGWVVSGKVPSIPKLSLCNFSKQGMIGELSKFFALDEVKCDTSKIFTNTEQSCEEIFEKTTVRDSNGRFIVKLPTNEKINLLGDSKIIALQRFMALERKFAQNSNLKNDYFKFIKEYIDLGHMTKIACLEEQELKLNENNPEYFLPHHAVFKHESVTTKLRVVFDASAKTDTDISLNDALLVGPNLQDELFNILLRFRKYEYIIIADIEKMYRQVIVNKKDRKLQKIFWRFNTSESIDIYELNTVTYGTAPASYLATKCLQQTALENSKSYPVASQRILLDFYMDDLLTGANSKKETIQLAKDIKNVVASGGFNLRKWSSNDAEILSNINCEFENDQSPVNLLNEQEQFKALGITYNVIDDSIQYSLKGFKNTSPVTKRSVLSNVAQIFDPLGILGPVTIKLKLIVQKLWQSGLGWDQSLPADIHTEFLNLRENLECLKLIKVPRHVICKNAKTVELHGFSDASMVAYGAVIYIKSLDEFGNAQSNILTSKTRVAPCRTITLPRLELCGALLLSRLVSKVIASIEINFDKVVLWSDSKIVLSWINSHPSRWQTFVANRISEIQDLTNSYEWQYIKGIDNPADLITRGVKPQELHKLELWWNPNVLLSTIDFSKEFSTDLEIESFSNSEVLKEERKAKVKSFTASYEFNLFSKYSNLLKLKRVLSYILRFKNNSLRVNQNKVTSNYLTAEELNNALTVLVKNAQINNFKQEINCLKQGQTISKQSKIIALNPFLDKENVLRVGGRLKHSIFSYDKKYPIILPHDHNLTYLMKEYHHKLLHCGPQLLLATVREKYWPIGGKNIAKKITKGCITCFKAKPVPMGHLMGNLPEPRVNYFSPFTNTGVDYCGPFEIKNKPGRGSKLIKCYICIFVCLSVKAIHLELVSNLTTEGFLSALKRFFARRGKCSIIFSDNGTNFVGAERELTKMLKFLQSDPNIGNFLSNEGIIWKFNPPSAPHFGGIWEAGVKSVKHHLKRLTKNINFTYEDLNSVLCQIEAILNSRPLSPLSHDPNDYNPLTPAHFIIGKPLTTTPELNYTETFNNRLSKFQLNQKIVQQFWKRWSLEYISQLQYRQKWKTNSQNVKIGDLVIIINNNLPVQKWQLGRVIQTHPGKDNVVRVVTVKCSDGSVLKRPVKKLCKLPLSDDCK